MTQFMAFMQKYGLYIGLSFTALVGGLLLYLHLFATITVPHLYETPTGTPDILICEGEVPWATTETVGRAADFWEARGHHTGVIRHVPCGSLGMCLHSKDRAVPCSPGNIVITLRDTMFSDTHGGETLWQVDEATRHLRWASIMLPSKLLEPTSFDGEEEIPSFPPDVEALVIAHELGHWWSYDHAVTPIAGPFVAIPTGHIMHPSVFKLGWRDEGLPPAN